MASDPHTPTQIYRQVQQGQTLEHVARIQELEARLGRLEDELAAARRAGGTAELQALPAAALQVLLGVFDAVPIPDLSAWERRQSVQRLSGALEALEARGPEADGLPAGTWSADPPALAAREGDGAAVARATGEVVRVLGEVASKYLAQMVEFQGTTPDQVARARASHLMDASSLVDAKAQYGLLPADSQRALFEQHIDQLVVAKDQLYVVTRWMAEARDLARELVGRQGLQAARRASLLGLLRLLAERDAQDPPGSLREDLHRRVLAYGALLPEAAVLDTLQLADTPYQRAYGDTIGPDGAGGAAEAAAAPAQFLTGALQAVLCDHEAIAAGLRAPVLDARERKALTGLAKTHAASRVKAAAALAQVAAQRAALDEAHAREEALQRGVVKRFSAALEREARARIGASPRPAASAAAFEQLSKAERTAHLAALWLKLVHRLAALLADGEEGLPAQEARLQRALARALPGGDRAALAARRRALEAAANALRNPEEGDETLDLTLRTPIDVEEGLLRRQAQDLAARTDELLGKYSQAKKAGMRSLAEAVETLQGIEALSRGKKAALDALLKKPHQGKHTSKREADTARALLDEQGAVEEGRRRIEARKASAFAAARPRLEALGLQEASAFDPAWARVLGDLDLLAEAEAAQVALTEREAQVNHLAARLQGGPAPSMDAARALSAALAEEARGLTEQAQAVEAARTAYLDVANRALRRRAGDFGAARLALQQVTSELETVDALRAAGERYLAGFAAFRRELTTLDKVRAWVGRERKKAADLQAELTAGAQAVQRAAAKLADGDARS